MSRRETALEMTAREAALIRGGIALKLKTPGRNGAPDRVVILPGPRIGFLELKRDRAAEYQPGQKRFIEALRNLGCLADVAHTQKEVLRFVERLAWCEPMRGTKAALDIVYIPPQGDRTAFGHEREPIE